MMVVLERVGKKSKCQMSPLVSGTLSPIIMEAENYQKRKEANIGGIHFPTSMIMGGRDIFFVIFLCFFPSVFYPLATAGNCAPFCPFLQAAMYIHLKF